MNINERCYITYNRALLHIMNYRYFLKEVISIIFFIKKYIVFFLSLCIGVMLSGFSVVKLNHVYAQSNNENHDTTFLVSYYWLILIIGGLILITLTYVSWRKYKGTIKQKKDRGAND